MAAYSRVPVPFLQPVNGSGVPYPAAKLYFYIANTTTPLDTYTDAALSVPNAHPVVADANGIFPVIYLGSSTYDVVLKTSADATVWTAEDVAATALSSATTTVTGTVELATTAEALTGSSTSLAMTPATVAASIQQGFSYGTTSGSANAVIVTPTITPSALAAGMTCTFRASSTNTAATTLDYGGLGPIAVKVHGASGATACNGGEFIANNVYTCTYSSSDSCWLVDAAGWTPAALNALTAETAVVDGDKFLMYDVSGKVPKSVTAAVMGADAATMEAATSASTFTTPANFHRHPASPKFWCLVTVSGGNPTLSSTAKFNVDSIADTGVGLMTITIGTDFSSTSWCCLATVEEDYTGGDGAHTCNIDEATQTAGAITISNRATGASSEAALDDPTAYHVVGFGDQA